MAGYSATPLEKKLGIKPGFKLCIINAPDSFAKTLAIPSDVKILKNPSSDCDMFHVFVESEKDMVKSITLAQKNMKQNGMIWVSWPKKSSGIISDVTEDTIRNFALTHGLVDVKVCAVDDVWSGLKLVIPVKNRK